MLHSYDVALVAKMDAFSDMTEPFQIFSTPSQYMKEKNIDRRGLITIVECR